MAGRKPAMGGPTPLSDILQSHPAKRLLSGEKSTRRADPWAKKTVILPNGYAVTLQENRTGKFRTMEIRFGNGRRDTKPPQAVLDFMHSHKITVTGKDGVAKEVQLFRWNEESGAWGMTIGFDNPKASRIKVERIFREAVTIVAGEYAAGRTVEAGQSR
jgi:hypothetical protein